MATTSDPRAASFDAAKFRDAIKFAMNMGLPPTEAHRATFRWKTVRTFAAADSGGKPFTKTATAVTTVSHDDVQIDCAVEFVARATLSGGTPLGDFDTPRAKITVLDVDHPAIVGATEVLLGGNTYRIDFTEPSVGLFGVEVYTIHCSAIDEN